MSPIPGEVPLPLFGEPDKPTAAPAAPAADRPAWKRLTGRQRPRCQLCLAMQAAKTLNGMAETARWQRTAPESVMLLCAAHADPIKTADNQEGR